LADAALTDVDAKLEQLTVDPWCTPRRILSAHLADQASDLTGNDRSSRLAVRAFQLQKRQKPLRCQATTVSGSTTASAERQSLQMRDSQTHNRRSPGVSFGRFLADLRSTPIW
jgi:hypothetical protein